ncbi:MAG: APC family permease [Anaerolineaceae bacterium]
MEFDNGMRTNTFEKTTEHVPGKSWRTWLFGKPLSSGDAHNQTIGKVVGLAVFSSDALSSVAYGPQETMTVLALAGVASLPLALPVVGMIAVLLAILTFSYEQTIHAYPGGGGAYIVARDNLGELPAQMAGAALLTDYILTVAVSISSGVAQLVSAYPKIFPYRVEIAISLILLIMVINLRGVKESGITFAIPTYFFLVMMLGTIGFGFFRFFTGTLQPMVDPPPFEVGLTQPLTIFLILRAFANGTASVTGVEAISNGITAFKEPSSKNAGITLIWMAGILGSLLLGTTFLATQIHALPAESETVISQIARTVYDSRGILYLATITATTVILVMAANTAFADFPRLGALQANDGFLPRQLTYRGSRLVFSRGIVTLALFSSALVILFKASVSLLIPLYAIGVFLSFSLSQAGMARRWWKSGRLTPDEEIKEPGSILRFENSWRFKMIVNAIGAACTFIVMIIFGVTKFMDGAWIVVVLIPILVTVFFAIHKHYKRLARQLSLDNHTPSFRVRHNRVIIPIAGVHRGTLEALRFAQTISDDVTAVFVSTDPKETAKIDEKWAVWGEGFRLVILNSPFRLFLEPLMDYIDKLYSCCQPGDLVTIVVPQFVAEHWWDNFLHTRTAEALRKVLLKRENIVIMEVPYQVK